MKISSLLNSNIKQIDICIWIKDKPNTRCKTCCFASTYRLLTHSMRYWIESNRRLLWGQRPEEDPSLSRDRHILMSLFVEPWELFAVYDFPSTLNILSFALVTQPSLRPNSGDECCLKLGGTRIWLFGCPPPIPL